MSDSEEHYHNKGQEDAQKGDYDEPHGVGDSLTTWSDSGMKKNREDNEAYKKGHAHSKGQSDGAENSYNPPSNSKAKKAYDKSWNESYKKKKSQESSCFLTTACVRAMGLLDNCQELEMLRDFRDSYLAKQSGGNKIISEYYAIAPQIIEEIDCSKNSNKVYSRLYSDLVKPACELIKSDSKEEAVALYKSVVERLKVTYLL